MQKILKKLSNLKTVISLLILFIIAYVLINGNLGVAKLNKITEGVSILDIEPGYSASQAYDLLKKQGELGRKLYKNTIIPMDFFFLTIYTFFFLSTIHYLGSKYIKKEKFLQYITFIPILAGVFDCIENILILNMLSLYPSQLLPLATASSIFTILKTIFTLVSMLLIIISLLIVIAKFIRNKIQTKV